MAPPQKANSPLSLQHEAALPRPRAHFNYSFSFSFPFLFVASGASAAAAALAPLLLMALAVAAGSSADSLDDDESGLIWAIRYLEIEVVEKMLDEGECCPRCAGRRPPRLSQVLSGPRRCFAGVSQRFLDCGLHEIATGERDSEAHRSARLHIASRLIECGGDPDNRQHGCGGTPLHHTLAGGYVELVRFLLDAQADVNASNRCAFRGGRRIRAGRGQLGVIWGKRYSGEGNVCLGKTGTRPTIFRGAGPSLYLCLVGGRLVFGQGRARTCL
jgi:hypothetical protein